MTLFSTKNVATKNAMRIVQWQLHRRHVPLRQRTECAKNQWRAFDGFFLVLFDGQGNCGIGEASPLAGHSVESLEDSRLALESMCTSIEGTIFHNMQQIEDAIASFDPCPPTALFALETALLDLLAQNNRIPLWNLLAPQPGAVRVNGLLSKSRFKEESEKMYNAGIRVFKVKVGIKGQHSDELQRLHWLRNHFGKNIEIRLDANCALPHVEVNDRINDYTKIGPSFIEEPIAFDPTNPMTNCPIPLAADESLLRAEFHNGLLAHQDYSTFVLKPSLLGGIFKTRALAKLANKHNKQVVLTHMFESLPAFLAIAHLAYALHTPSACGLYPHEGLGEHQSDSSFNIENGHLQLSPSIGLGIDAMAFLKE